MSTQQRRDYANVASSNHPKKIQSQPTESAHAVADLNAHMVDRLLFLLANLVGTTVHVQVTTGLVYEGIFHSAQSDQDMGVVLRMTRKLEKGKKPDRPTADSIISYLIIQAKDVVGISVSDVDLSFAMDKTASVTASSRHGFQTDTAISGHSGDVHERILERWMPDGSVEAASLDNGNTSKTWDQFAVNEKLFGVTTDFNEELYTTKLDKNSEEYRRREKDAALLAKQIEKSAANNIHLAEERGLAIDDSQMDEEDRYGAVVRKPGTYIPPALRKKIENPQNLEAKPEGMDAPKSELEGESLPLSNKVDTVTESSSKSMAKLNINANAFKFNLLASEFTPTTDTIKSSTVNRSPPRKHQEYSKTQYVFGKALSRGALSIKALLLENFKRSSKNPSYVVTSRELWPFGQRTYVEVVQFSNSSEYFQPQLMYGYPYGAYTQPGRPFGSPVRPIPFGLPPQSIPYPFPAMAPALPMPVPMIPGYPYPGYMVAGVAPEQPPKPQ